MSAEQWIEVDGAVGEGGGQILRTALALSLITGRPTRIYNIRAGRRNPGLAAQHLVSVWAAAALCSAELEGAELGSTSIRFRPRRSARSGDYLFDVSTGREGGSAGATTLILQTLLVPLALAAGSSNLLLKGGTHVAWAPFFEYVEQAWLPALARMGLHAQLSLKAWGFYPIGGGEIESQIAGGATPATIAPLEIDKPGKLVKIHGQAVAANLPAHIPQRMADRARALLQDAAAEVAIEPLRVRAASPGASLFLAAKYENICCGFSALGRPGLASERVAELASDRLLAHRSSGAAMDFHLADQMLLPMALARGPSYFTTDRASQHLRTNAWVIEHFGVAAIDIEARAEGSARIAVRPKPADA